MADGYVEGGVYVQGGIWGVSIGVNLGTLGINFQGYQQISAGVSASTGVYGSVSLLGGIDYGWTASAGVGTPSFVPLPVSGSALYNFNDQSVSAFGALGSEGFGEVGLYGTVRTPDPNPASARIEYLKVTYNPRQSIPTEVQNPNFDKTDSFKYNGPQIGGTSPSEVARNIEVAKQPGITVTPH